jgi:hypothetical protein
MDEFRIGYTVGGQRKEIEFKPERGQAAPFDFLRAVVAAENPGSSIASRWRKSF